MATIDFNKVPVEPTIDIIDSEGNIVVTTNNNVVFLYARVQIKHLHLEGWKVRCHSNDYIANITKEGKIEFWDQGSFPGDEAGKLLMELV